MDLDAQNMPIQSFKGFPASALENPNAPQEPAYYYHSRGRMGYWHPGYAWACTRAAWNTFGGLLDINIVGGGDHQMAHGFYGRYAKTIPFKSTKSYKSAVVGWQYHASKLAGNVGFVPGSLLHYWHGPKHKRGYFDRWRILADNKYDPIKDVRRDWQGLLQLAGNKPKDSKMTAAEFKSIRLRAGLTQSQLAERLRVEDLRTIRRYEAGDRAISGPVSLLMEQLGREHQ